MTTTDIRTIFGAHGQSNRFYADGIDVKVVLVHAANGPLFMVQGVRKRDFGNQQFINWLDATTKTHPDARVIMFDDTVTCYGNRD